MNYWTVTGWNLQVDANYYPDAALFPCFTRRPDKIETTASGVRGRCHRSRAAQQGIASEYSGHGGDKRCRRGSVPSY